MSAVVQTRAEWLHERRSYLGATDLAAISGFSKYKSPLEVWMEKTGRGLPDSEMNVAASRGLALEAHIAAIYEAVENCTLVPGTLIRHPKHPFIGCNPDRIVVGRNQAVELKSYNIHVRKEWGDDGTDQVPISHWTQAQVQRGLLELVLGGEWAVEVFGYDCSDDSWSQHPIPRRVDVFDALIEAGARFWADHVLADVPPPAGGMDCDTHWLARAFPYGEGEEPVFATKAIDKAAEEVLRLKAEANPLYSQAKAQENLLKQFMGKATRLITMSGDWTFKNDKPSTDWEAVARYCWREALLEEDLSEVDPDRDPFAPSDWDVALSVHTHQEVNWERVALARGASLDLIAEHTTIDGKGTKRIAWKEIAALLGEEEDGLPGVFMYPVTYWEGVAKAFKPGDDVVALFTTPGSRRFLAPRKK